MPVIWGCLDRVEPEHQDAQWVQVTVALPGGSTIRARARVGKETLIARGIERVDLASLCRGELVEISYHHGRKGFMEAETIYVQAARTSTTEKFETL